MVRELVDLLANQNLCIVEVSWIFTSHFGVLFVHLIIIFYSAAYLLVDVFLNVYHNMRN